MSAQSILIPQLTLPLSASLTLPGSKSHANRAIICACLSEGTTMIQNATPCDDVLVMVENLQKLGFHLAWLDRLQGKLEIKGGLPRTQSQMPNANSQQLDCHNAGTTLRFLTSLACIVPGEWIISGNAHMQKRPIRDLVDALRALGADIEATNGCPPIRIRGGKLKGGTVKLKADISSQYLSSLMMIAPMLEEGLTIELQGPLASEGYVDLTRKVMGDFGVIWDCSGSKSAERRRWKIESDAEIRSKFKRLIPNSPYDIEGDWSAAGPWLVLAERTKSDLRLTNLNAHSEQSDSALPEIIASMRALGDITVDCTDVPDQLMNLTVLAAFRSGRTTFTGAKNLRHKECDRIAVITSELQKVGVDIEEHEDGVVVRNAKFPTFAPPGFPAGGQIPNSRKSAKSQPPQANSCTLDPHDDHRMVMAFAIIGLMTGNVEIQNPECVAKSYPRFFDDLKVVLASTKPVAIVGMRGVGKSSLGRKIAAKLNLKHVDSDHVFIERFGDIRSFVATHGWERFRQEEAKIVDEILVPGVILSCGGGAVESADVRKVLKDRAIVLWLQARESVLISRLKSGKRPPLTKLPLHEEVRMLSEKRHPLYAEIATVTIPPTVKFSEQVGWVCEILRSVRNSNPSGSKPDTPRPRTGVLLP